MTQLLLLHNHYWETTVYYIISQIFNIFSCSERQFPSAEYLVLSDRGPAAAAPGAP